jgi:hypothetical protein
MTEMSDSLGKSDSLGNLLRLLRCCSCTHAGGAVTRTALRMFDDGRAAPAPLDPTHGLPIHHLRSSPEDVDYTRRWALARLIVVVPMLVVMRMVSRGGSALTGRIGRHSTAGLAVVAAASLVLAQLDEGVGRSHPQLGSEGGVVGGPVGKEGPSAWSRPRLLAGLWHNANTTTKAVAAPVRAR